MKLTDFLPFYKKRRQQQTQSARAFLTRYQGHFRSQSIYLQNIYNKIAVDIGAGLEFKHIKVSKHDGQVDEWFEYNTTNSDLLNVLEFSPNSLETPTVFWSSVTYKIVKDGLAIVIPVYAANGSIEELVLVDALVEMNGTTLKLSVKVGNSTEIVEVDAGSVWIFENPKKNLTAQLEQLTGIIDMNLSVLSEKLSSGNSSMKAVIHYNTTKSSDGELKAKMEERVANILEVAQHGGIGYLDKDEELEELKNDYAMASDGEVKQLKNQLFEAFGLNEAIFTGNYTEIQYRAYYQSVLMPIVKTIREEITKKYFTKTARSQGQILLIQTDLISISSLKDLGDFIAKGSYSATLNANEGRSFLGMAPYEGGDVYQTNKNALTMSQVNAEEENVQSIQTDEGGSDA